MFPSATRWSEIEMDVAETLRDLYSISLLSSVPFGWRCKRKRSLIQNNTSPSPNKRLCTFNGLVLKGGNSNPTTPLSLPTTESDEKHNISLIMKTIEDMKKTQASLNRLNREIENVKKQFGYDQLKNLEMRKQEFRYPNLKIGEKVKGLINNSKSRVENEEQKKDQHQVQQTQMLCNHQNQTSGPFSIGLGRNININSNGGPIALPDLHLLIREITANRVIAAAQARRRRLQIIRIKKNRK